MKRARPRADTSTPLGMLGTIGTGARGQKPREKAAQARYGRRTQGECSGHELCNEGRCGHRRG